MEITADVINAFRAGYSHAVKTFFVEDIRKHPDLVEAWDRLSNEQETLFMDKVTEILKERKEQ